jgi:hypothetical protein
LRGVLCAFCATRQWRNKNDILLIVDHRSSLFNVHPSSFNVHGFVLGRWGVQTSQVKQTASFMQTSLHAPTLQNETAFGGTAAGHAEGNSGKVRF